MIVISLAWTFSEARGATTYTWRNETNHEVTLDFGYEVRIGEGTLTSVKLLPGTERTFRGFPHVNVYIRGGRIQKYAEHGLFLAGEGVFDAPSGVYDIIDGPPPTPHLPINPFPPDAQHAKVFGALVLSPNIAKIEDIPLSELKEPHREIDEMFRAVHEWATAKGFKSACPDFERGSSNRGEVIQAIVVTNGEIVGIPVDELDVSTIDSRFRSVGRWAASHNFVGGYPNFNQGIEGGRTVIQAVLFKAPDAEVVETPKMALTGWKDFETRMRCFHRWGGVYKPFNGDFVIPNCEQR